MKQASNGKGHRQRISLFLSGFITLDVKESKNQLVELTVDSLLLFFSSIFFHGIIISLRYHIRKKNIYICCQETTFPFVL